MSSFEKLRCAFGYVPSAALTTEFAMQTRTLSRSRALRSKRHAVGTSPAHKWRSISKLYILLVQERIGKFRVSEKLEIDPDRIYKPYFPHIKIR